MTSSVCTIYKIPVTDENIMALYCILAERMIKKIDFRIIQGTIFLVYNFLVCNSKSEV